MPTNWEGVVYRAVQLPATNAWLAGYLHDGANTDDIYD